MLLPDHMHALWTLPPGDEDSSHRWRVIKRMVTQRRQTRLNRPEWMNSRRKKRNQSTLWQHRFWKHLIRDEADFNRHIDYIHWDPVKHGYGRRRAIGRIRASIGMSNRAGCQQIGEATSNHSTALTSANELARTRALRSLMLQKGYFRSLRQLDRNEEPFGVQVIFS